MSTPKPKFYVVWKGRKTGLFNTWEECKEQVHGYDKAVYKSFKNRELALQALNSPSNDFIGKDVLDSTLSPEQRILIGEPIFESISVDGAWNTGTGVVEYQGVETKTKKVLFRVDPYDDGTINMVEFLAIVHGLSYCKKNNLDLPIYSDSKVAISWVRDKIFRTSHELSEKNQKLFELLERAVKWLKENEYQNKILKWETQAWGENPADFGRK
jgi:ribonuclease HI